MAKLYFRYSPMNSGKSIHLLQTANNYKERNMEVMLLTSKKDTRSGCGVIHSRLGISEPAFPLEEKEDLIAVELAIQLREIKALFVDEAQFLPPSTVDKLADIVDNYDIPVFCYGLKTDYTSHLFPGSQRLLELADSITELKSICACGRKAIINARNTKETDQVVIGGEEVYTTVCRKCFKEKY